MDSNPLELYVHFGVEEHFIPVGDFATSSKSITAIAESINQHIFNGELKYQLVIIPPESGSFLKKIGIIFIGGALITGLLAEYSSGFFKGLTGHPLSYYAEKHGEALKDLIKGILETLISELEKCIPNEVNLDKAYKAKSDFYKMCLKNEKIHSLGFDKSGDFPIKRNQFFQHISKDRIRPVDSDFVIHDAIVISPVDINKDTQWVFQDRSTGSTIKAYMRDEAFKRSFLNGNFPMKKTAKDDILTILIEYKKRERNGEVESREVCIETVYLFNDVEITPLPEKNLRGVKFQRSTETPMEEYWNF